MKTKPNKKKWKIATYPPVFTVAEYNCIVCEKPAYARDDEVICIGCIKEEHQCICKEVK